MNIIHQLLRESLVFEILEDMLGEDYPASFNHEEFKAQQSFAARKRYCDEHLSKIASGTGRIVYKIDDEKVLKLAKNKKGLAQNEVEIDTSNDYYAEATVARIFSYDENNLWVEMELARKVTDKNFEAATGIPWLIYIPALKNEYVRVNGKSRGGWIQIQQQTKTLPDSTMEMLYENEFFTNMADYMNTYNLPVADLVRLTSYGLVKRDGSDDIVMIDYGLTWDVYDSYYS